MDGGSVWVILIEIENSIKMLLLGGTMKRFSLKVNWLNPQVHGEWNIWIKYENITSLISKLPQSYANMGQEVFLQGFQPGGYIKSANFMTWIVWQSGSFWRDVPMTPNV